MLTMAEREFAFQEEFVSLKIDRGSCSCRSDKDIFFHGLIENCCDALDKASSQSKLDVPPDLFIRVIPDKATNTLTIRDSGIGMTWSDLLNNLPPLRAGADLSSIGQFAFAFHAAFSVAEKVIITTKHNDDEQLVLESDATETFGIGRDQSGQKLGRGTKITLYLKEDQLEYLEERTLKDLIDKHRNDINYPLLLRSVEEEKEISDHEEEEEEEEEERKRKSEELPRKNEKVGGCLPPWIIRKHELEKKKNSHHQEEEEEEEEDDWVNTPDENTMEQVYVDAYKRALSQYCGKESDANTEEGG